jgi:glycosyltransferase involved in cell wall biosynthesis
MALELAKLGALGVYYSGYPEWKLPHRETLSVRTHSFRTTIVYGLLKFAPARLRPSSRSLFLWQDRGFDRAVGRSLEPSDFIHGLPGQCVETFRAARRLGVPTVLNHATGPVRDLVKIMEPEYARVGLKLTDFCAYDEAYFAQEEEEYALSDWHCVASSVVKDALAARGIAPERIWQVPYGADQTIFQPRQSAPPPSFRMIFAGQLSLRKGVKSLLDALALAGRPDWQIDFFGPDSGEVSPDVKSYSGPTPLHFHGAVSQSALADALRAGSVLVLPSWEEGFGLVVPQALNCGIPAIVSDRVGAKDLIQHRVNGSIFPVGNAAALAAELAWWAENPRTLEEKYPWDAPARTLVAVSEAAKWNDK